MNLTDQAIEAEIQAKGLTAARVTPADVEEAIASEHYFTAYDGVFGALADKIANKGWAETLDDGPDARAPLNMITICVMLLRNGHKIVGVNTGPVSPENFDAELARKLARDNAVDQVWPLLGYALRDRLAAAGGAA